MSAFKSSGSSGIAPEQLSALVTDTDLATALAPRPGQVARYVANQVPAGYRVATFYAGATQGYDGVRDFVNRELGLKLNYRLMNVDDLPFDYAFDEPSLGYPDSRQQMVINVSETGISSCNAVVPPNDVPWNAQLELEIALVSNGTREAAFLRLDAENTLPGGQLIKSALEANTGKSFIRFYIWNPRAIHRVAADDIRIYAQVQSELTGGEYRGGTMMVRFDSVANVVIAAQFLPDLYLSATCVGVHDLLGYRVLCDYATTGFQVRDDGTLIPFSVAYASAVYASYRTPVNNKLYGVTPDGAMYQSLLSVVTANETITALNVLDEQRLFSFDGPVKLSKRGTNLVVLGRVGVYELSDTSTVPKLVQLVHPLLASLNNIVPMHIYRQNDVDVLVGSYQSEMPADENGYFMFYTTSVAFDYAAAKSACLVDVVKE